MILNELGIYTLPFPECLLLNLQQFSRWSPVSRLFLYISLEMPWKSIYFWSGGKIDFPRHENPGNLDVYDAWNKNVNEGPDIFQGNSGSSFSFPFENILSYGL